MLREFLQEVVRLAESAKAVKVIEVPLERGVRYLVQRSDGTADWEDALPPNFQAEVRDLDSLARLARVWNDEPEHDPGNDNFGRPAVWHSPQAVTLLRGDTYRRHHAVLKLAKSRAILELENFEARKVPLGQQAFRLMLRTVFHDCQTCNIVDVLRRLKWSVNQQGESVVSHAGSSLGREVRSAVEGESAIPEVLRLHVPLWDGVFGFRVNVEVAVEVDPAVPNFTLIPLAGRLTAAQEAGQEFLNSVISQALTEHGCPEVPVYCGRP